MSDKNMGWAFITVDPQPASELRKEIENLSPEQLKTRDGVIRKNMGWQGNGVVGYSSNEATLLQAEWTLEALKARYLEAIANMNFRAFRTIDNQITLLENEIEELKARGND